MKMPTFDQLILPTLKALESLGGSGSIEEIANTVILDLNLPDSVTSQPHNPDKPSRTEVEYRLAWARTYLKKYGLIDNSDRGVWALTPQYKPGQDVNVKTLLQRVRADSSARSKKKDECLLGEEDALPSIAEEVEAGWKEILHQQLLQLKPDAFERLAMRLLRESGFVQVEVTGRSGDGGIDGKGIIKLQNVLSYHVVFQCKRYKESVGAGAIRDFRGAMIGRADKGLFITTGAFTRDAIKEATRDGASPIDLIDGEDLVDMLKQLRLGVEVHMVEEVEINTAWFENI
ncbi:restriction endonuclease [Desulfovibrio falkowii]|uniref:Restriction endonuclease n=1 Tax=Desulfovibrio falkowii TaxID=3136602 RepID=A0ABQ0EBB3_9BACT